MKYGSVCSGIEAASLAWAPLGWKATFVSEVEPFPATVLMQRWNATKPKRPLEVGEAATEKDKKMRESWQRTIAGLPDGGSLPNLGDFPKITKEDYEGDIDLLVGGCPCQSYSIAGLRQGLEDPRGNLTLEFVRLAYRTGARWLVFENVPGILSSGDKGSDFAEFLSLLTGWEVKPPKDGWRNAGVVTNAPGCFGVAWRVLDAQYTRVSSFPGAVPQRRRRVILVGYLGDWQRAAQVLFDGEVRQGDTPPKRKSRTTASGNPEASPGEPCLLRMRSGCEGGGKGALIGENLSHTLATGNDQVCFDLRRTGDVSNERSPTLMATDYKGGKAISFYPSFLGKGTAPCEECNVTLVNAGAPGHSNAVILFDQHNGGRFTERQETALAVVARYGTGGNSTPVVVHQEAFGFQKNDAGGIRISEAKEIAPTLRSGVLPSVAIAENIIGREVQNGGNGTGAQENVSYTLNATGVHGVAYPTPTSGIVRRLLPVECERLQGMPDNYTQIEWKGKPLEECPDAPRYKALGNSMAVNVMRWVGERIQAVEEENNGR